MGKPTVVVGERNIPLTVTDRSTAENSEDIVLTEEHLQRRPSNRHFWITLPRNSKKKMNIKYFKTCDMQEKQYSE